MEVSMIHNRFSYPAQRSITVFKNNVLQEKNEAGFISPYSLIILLGFVLTIGLSAYWQVQDCRANVGKPVVEKNCCVPIVSDEYHDFTKGSVGWNTMEKNILKALGISILCGIFFGRREAMKRNSD